MIPTNLAAPSQIFVPVRADGLSVRDNAGDVIASCFTPEMAAKVADLINQDAGLSTPAGRIVAPNLQNHIFRPPSSEDEMRFCYTAKE